MEATPTAKAPKPYLQVFYNTTDISKDISGDLESFTYDDKVGGESDEIILKLNDPSKKWLNSWYPKKGDQLQVKIGYQSGKTIDCGFFSIDKITYTTPPNMIEIRGVSAAFNTALRTPKSFVHEGKTLRQIAEKISKDNLLELVGDIAEIKIEHETQNRDTDLAFLMKLAKRFGYQFSVKGKQLVFVSVYELDGAPSVASLGLSDLSRLTFDDQLDGTFIDAEIAYDTLEGVQTNLSKKELVYGGDTAPDTCVLRGKAENPAQTDAMTRFAVYEANTNAQKLTIKTKGNILLIAGNNFDLVGAGVMSGKWQIEKSSHSISESGYLVSVDARRSGMVDV